MSSFTSTIASTPIKSHKNLPQFKMAALSDIIKETFFTLFKKLMRNAVYYFFEKFPPPEMLPTLEKFHTLEIFYLGFLKNIKITQPPMANFPKFEIIPCERNIPNS